jgi:HEXXH motif-containing protein
LIVTDIFAIPAAAQDTLDLARACRYALLADRLADAGSPEALAESGLGWIDTLPLSQLTRRGTPFFWLNVARCHLVCDAEQPEWAARLRQLLMTAFDAFFELLPDGATWALPAAEGELVLPRLGVAVPLPAEPLRLRRVRALRAEIEIGPGGVAQIPLDPPGPGMRLNSLPIQDGSARLLLSRHPALFPDGLVPEIDTELPDPAAQAELIAESLELIAQADAELGREIQSRIGWYVPIIGRQAGLHRSFTSPQLGGVMFLSAGQDRIQLAEAIVHEYYHHVLNNRMDAQPLLSDNGPGLFYSPWRDDPRPLPMLLHALYVFAGVSQFFVRVEAVPPLAAYHDRLRQRRRTIAQQLRLGMAPVPAAAFTPEGRLLLQGIEEVIGRQERDLALPLPRLPEGLAAHLLRWRQAHPHLAPQVAHLG